MKKLGGIVGSLVLVLSIFFANTPPLFANSRQHVDNKQSIQELYLEKFSRQPDTAQNDVHNPNYQKILAKKLEHTQQLQEKFLSEKTDSLYTIAHKIIIQNKHLQFNTDYQLVVGEAAHTADRDEVVIETGISTENSAILHVIYFKTPPK